MKKTHKQTIFLAAILTAVLLPALGLAALQLEYTYPQLPGAQTITSKSSLGDVIQYFISAAVLIAVLAAIISLIVAGVQYLTSSGKPGQMQSAKSRIFNSVLGLAILFGSYLVLITVNPQLVLMKIERVPLTSGILLFSEEGYKELFVDTPPADLSDLIDRGKVKPLNYEIYDSEKEFGPLAVSETNVPASPLFPSIDKRVNFASFPLYAIGFWGKDVTTAKNVKVIGYSRPNFNSASNDPLLQPRVYTWEGKIKEKEEPAGSGTFVEEKERASVPKLVNNEPISVIVLYDRSTTPPAPYEDFFTSEVSFIDKLIEEYNSMTKQEKDALSPDRGTVFHPPLSIGIKGIGPGVFLYSSEGQRYFLASHDNLGRGDIDFDNKAEWIEINNIVKEQGQAVKKYDYLATLHTEAYFTGNLKMFFERRTLDNIIPRIYFYTDFDKDHVDKVDLTNSTAFPHTPNGAIDDKNTPSTDDDEFTTYPANIAKPAGLVEPKKKIPINGKYTVLGSFGGDPGDYYGFIEPDNKASSIQIFELSDDYSVCQEVRICTEKGIGSGYCISFTPNGKRWKGAYNSVTLPLPFYFPGNIPGELKGEMLLLDEKDGKVKPEITEKKFAKKIKSIYIRGDCLVALFENRFWDGTAWEDGVPGAHSEIFTKSDLDLTNNPIGMCGGGAKLKPGEGKPCAASIVVFPLKGE